MVIFTYVFVHKKAQGHGVMKSKSVKRLATSGLWFSVLREVDRVFVYLLDYVYVHIYVHIYYFFH